VCDPINPVEVSNTFVTVENFGGNVGISTEPKYYVPFSMNILFYLE
jgi:hypothetical protein